MSSFFRLASIKVAAARASDPAPKGGFRSFKWGDRPLVSMRSRGPVTGMEEYDLTGEPSRVAGVDPLGLQPEAALRLRNADATNP